MRLKIKYHKENGGYILLQEDTIASGEYYVVQPSNGSFELLPYSEYELYNYYNSKTDVTELREEYLEWLESGMAELEQSIQF